MQKHLLITIANLSYFLDYTVFLFGAIMQYVSGMFAKVNELIFPCTTAGVAASLTEYKDPCGKVVKVAVDIMPIVSSVVAGPLAGGVTSLFTSGAKAAKAVYDYCTTPVTKEKVTKGAGHAGKSASAESGALLLKTAVKMVRDSYKKTSDDVAVESVRVAAEALKTVGEAAKSGVKGAVAHVAANVVHMGGGTAARALPEIVINLHGAAKVPVSTVFSVAGACLQLQALKKAWGEYMNIRKLNQTANSAIALIREVDAEETKRRVAPQERKKGMSSRAVTRSVAEKKKTGKKSSSRNISAEKAIKEVLLHKERAKKEYPKSK